MTNPSFEFTHAITRKPGKTIINGLRAEDTGTPYLDQMLLDHRDYIAALKETGAKVIELPALEDFADAVFVEDTALCLPEGAIMMRPGAISRQGEVPHMEPALSKLFKNVRQIEGPGTIEGGDILVTSKEVLVGQSERTNADGISELRAILTEWGHTLREVHTPPGVLHFKTDCSLLDGETILSTKRLAASGCFGDYNILYTVEGEEAAANTIRFNSKVIMPSGFPKTRNLLIDAGYEVVEINNSECAKLDGGMSCLSLRFSAD